MVFHREIKKTLLRENKDATYHNNHQEGPCLPTKASATTVASEILYSIRVTGSQPHPFTSSST